MSRRIGHRRSGAARRPPAAYTDREREDAGLALLRSLLERGDQKLQDLRHQLLVGADAIDKSNHFYELKVYAASAPNTVSLTASEIDRARDPDFFLVIVSNVEQGTGTPEVRFIADPLHRLAAVDDGSVTLSGVHQAEAFVYRMPLLGPSADQGFLP